MKLELRSIRIKNCGPIDDIKIDFFDASGKTLPVCVVAGANGSGKTTVLELIASLAETLASHTLNKLLKAKAVGFVQLDCVIDGRSFAIFLGELPSDFIMTEHHSGFQRVPLGLVSLSSDISTDLYQLINYQQGTGKRPYAKPETFDYDKQFPSIIYFPHNRSLEPVSGDQIIKEHLSYRFVHRIKTIRQFKGSLNSYLIWLDYAKPEMFRDTMRFLNKLDFDGKTLDINRESLDVVVRTREGKEHLLHELSSGEQNLLIILVELYRRLIPGSIVLIDEIENSLHPAFQHRLAQGLLALQKEIPYQLIVTTHAPAFVEIFGAENTRILTPF